MNILKFIKGFGSTAKKDVERNQKVLENLVVNIDSAQRVARVLHTKAYNPWSSSDRTALETAFKKQLGTDVYALLKPSERQDLIRRVANDVSRSPDAVLIRLRNAGLVKVKGNSKATLKAIADKATKSKKVKV